MVGFFQFWVELDRSELVQDVENLGHVHEHESEVPGEDVWSADYVPSPGGEEHQAWKKRSEGGSWGAGAYR